MSKKIEPFKTMSVQVINPEFFEIGEAYRWVNSTGDTRTGICKEVKDDEVTFVTTGKPVTMYANYISAGYVKDMRKLV